MNNRLIKLLVLISSISSLAGCSSASERTPTTLDKVLSSLKEASHNLRLFQTVSVIHPDQPSVVDIKSEITYDFGFYYQDEKRSHSREQTVFSYDIDKNTGLANEVTKRTTRVPLVTYYKNTKTGYAEIHKINLQNELEISTLVAEDSEGSFIPIVYDFEFKNPFDFITTRDLTLLDNGDILLSKSKANFLVEAYNTIGVNLIEEAIIKTNDKNQITSIEFDIPSLDGGSYIRENTLEIQYFNHDEAKYEQLKPFTNNNPELNEALTKYKNLTNFTYNKEYVTSTGSSIDRIIGYFTEDTIFFHHGSEEDNEPYKRGDNYDYKAVLEDGEYYVYQYDFVSVNYYQWNKVLQSESKYYSFSNFFDMGPRYFDISSSVFKKTGEKTYEIENILLYSSGQYFDYAVWGVHSSLLSSTTTHLKITLNDSNEIELIETGFMQENKTTYLKFYYTNINSTVIPSWMNNN
ncbi:MAG: hypothetical protein IKB70_07130 [Bacilli bacterium]|nr:hypothetical protein [Bacilli bacterium]